MIGFLRELLGVNAPPARDRAVDAEFEPVRDELSLAGLDEDELRKMDPDDRVAAAGLDEDELRKMDPDDRVAALERARLDPYDYIYLAC